MKESKNQIHKDKNLTVITVSGPLSKQRVENIIKDFYQSGSTLNVLWDVTEADLSSLHENDLRQIICIAKEHMHLREGGRTAIVVTSDLNYGISRMFEILSELDGLKISHLICKSINEAMDWFELIK